MNGLRSHGSEFVKAYWPDAGFPARTPEAPDPVAYWTFRQGEAELRLAATRNAGDQATRTMNALQST